MKCFAENIIRHILFCCTKFAVLILILYSLLDDYLKDKGMVFDVNRGYSIDTHNIWTKPVKQMLNPAEFGKDGHDEVELLNGGSRMADGKSSRLAARLSKGKGKADEGNEDGKKTKQVCIVAYI